MKPLLTLVGLLFGLAAALPAQSDLEKMLIEGASELEDPTIPTEHPDAVFLDSKNAMQFYFTALQPSKDSNLYVREGQDYVAIRPAYNTFGSLHQLTKRPVLYFYKKTTTMVDGEEEIVYVPHFEVPIGEKTRELLVIYWPRPGDNKSEETDIIPLPTVDLSQESIPYGKLTFLNPFGHPLALKVDDQVAKVPPRGVFQYAFKIERRGAGYVYVLLGWMKDGKPKKLAQEKLLMFQNSRALAMPYLSADGSGEMGIYVHRERKPQN